MDRNMIIKVVRDEWQSLYHNLSSEARTMRIQQWLVVVCCLLLFGGTVGFMYTQGLENLGTGERLMLRILSAAVLAVMVVGGNRRWRMRPSRTQYRSSDGFELDLAMGCGH